MFRDPDKAFQRLRHAFRADTGIQHGYEQASRIIRKLKSGSAVPLYNQSGRIVGELTPDRSKMAIAACVTRDNFGLLATNLQLLLERRDGDAYPWVVNIFDLQSLTEAWGYFGWTSETLRTYLSQRILLHGKVLSDDELDYAGYFIRHGSFQDALSVDADLLQLAPSYSEVFDEIHRHLHLDGPPVTIRIAPPVNLDLRRSFATGEPVLASNAAPQRKVGRNEMCPCGSGKKFKKCCGAPA